MTCVKDVGISLKTVLSRYLVEGQLQSFIAPEVLNQNLASLQEDSEVEILCVDCR